jgi:hypothetical protein
MKAFVWAIALWFRAKVKHCLYHWFSGALFIALIFGVVCGASVAAAWLLCEAGCWAIQHFDFVLFKKIATWLVWLRLLWMLGSFFKAKAGKA